MARTPLPPFGLDTGPRFLAEHPSFRTTFWAGVVAAPLLAAILLPNVIGHT